MTLQFYSALFLVVLRANGSAFPTFECQMSIVRHLLHQENSGETFCRGVADGQLDSVIFMDDHAGGNWSTLIEELSRCQVPTSVVSFASTNTTTRRFGPQVYLETGKTTSYFSHGIRSKEVSQLLVVIRSADTLKQLMELNVKKLRGGGAAEEMTKPGARNGPFVQMEPSFWFTYSRVILVFIDLTFSQGDEIDRTANMLMKQLTEDMNAYNVLFAWGANSSVRAGTDELKTINVGFLQEFASGQDQICPNIRYICLHCCENGAHCVKQIDHQLKAKHGDVRKILTDPSTTQFRGKVNGFTLQTTATNSFRTFYPSGRADARGNPDYTGFDVDVLKAFAQNMNFSYRWRRPEPTATWGSQLPNGSWNGIVGRIISKELDLSATVMSITHSRMLHIDFSFPYDYDGMHLMEAAPVPLQPGFSAIAQPFGSDTWICTFIFLIIVCFVLFKLLTISAGFHADTARKLRYNVEGDASIPKEARRTGVDVAVQATFEVYNSVVRMHPEKGLDQIVKVDNIRILLGTWSMLAMILTTYYLSIQFTLFFDVGFTPVLDTGEDYLKVPKTIVALKSSTGEDLFKAWGIHRRAVYVSPSEMAEKYLDRAATDRNMALAIWRNVIRNWLFNTPGVNTTKINPRRYRITKGYAMPFYSAVALQKRSLYTAKISFLCMRLQETGIIQYLNRHYAYVAGMYEASYEEMSYDPRSKARRNQQVPLALTLYGHLSGMFALLMCGLGVSTLVFLIEITSTRKPKYKKQTA